MVAFLLLLACSDSYKISADTAVGLLDSAEGSDTADTAEQVDTAAYEGATIVITSPRSGAFLPLGEPGRFTAEVRNPAGEVLPFAEVTWKSDVDSAWSLEGADVTDANLGTGTHALTATAVLPNGDRVAFGVGGVLVQSPYAGIYVGTLSVEGAAEYNGVPIVTACSGALTLTIDAEGEAAVGESSCPLNLFGFDVDTAYAFELEQDEGTLEGETQVLLYGFGTVSFDVEGSVDEDGTIEAGFGGNVFGVLDVTGDFEGVRVTRDLSGG